MLEVKMGCRFLTATPTNYHRFQPEHQNWNYFGQKFEQMAIFRMVSQNMWFFQIQEYFGLKFGQMAIFRVLYGRVSKPMKNIKSNLKIPKLMLTLRQQLRINLNRIK
jgi:hypothetical protein